MIYFGWSVTVRLTTWKQRTYIQYVEATNSCLPIIQFVREVKSMMSYETKLLYPKGKSHWTLSHKISVVGLERL